MCMCTIRLCDRSADAGLDMGSEHYCLRWNNHQSNLLGVFSQLLHDESLVDVTLACSEGASIRAHKVVLSACSSYFQALFLDHPSRHPIVILKDVHFAELRTLVEFMYKGEVNVQYCQLSALLKTAESLKVKGLAEMTNLNAAASTATSTTSTSSSTSLHESTSDIQIHHAGSTNLAATSSSSANSLTRPETVSSRNQTTNNAPSGQNQAQNNTSNQLHQPLVLAPPTHQPHDSQSRLHIDTLTRHDRKTNNGTLAHHATCTETSETSMKRLTNLPEESYTPPPRLEQSPLPLVTSSRVRTNRSEPPDPGPDNGSTPMVCDDNTDEHNAKTLNNNNTTTVMMHTNCTDVGLNMSLSASGSTEHSRLCVPASSGVLASSGSSGGASSSQVCRLPPAQPPATPPPLPDPVPGPSGLPPVQQVPLSLKKEVDWERAVEEIKAESSSAEYLRHAHDQREAATRMMVASPFSFPFQPPLFDPEASARLLALLQHHAPATTLGLGFRFNQLFAEDLLKHKHATEEALRQRRLEEETSVSSLEDNVRCNVCFASFPSAWLLEQHTALQHLPSGPPVSEDKPFICDQCGQSYRYRSAYVKHREQNHRARLPADKLFTCDVCGMQFRYLKSFKKHRLNHALERLHGKSDMFASGTSSDNQVSSSNEVLPVPGDAVEEMSDQDDTVDSATASATTAGSDVAKPALDSSEPDPDAEPEADSGEQAAANAGLDVREASLLNYLRADAVSRQRERRFACPFCGKCVRSKENLKLHVRKHTGERPFVCLFCGRAFGGKSDLTRHLRIHTGERPYHCEACGKCFARADYLSKHLTTHIHNAPR